MSKNKGKVWHTKYGARRVRHEAPTLQEAIVAAQGLSDELDAQADIAASLIGVPRDRVRAELLKNASPRRAATKSVAFVGSAKAPRSVVIERKPARRVVNGR
ncbi:MAG: hypothetical protein P8Y71_18425 [Pseudolabrys sp.]|jgi:hypothetical protein